MRVIGVHQKEEVPVARVRVCGDRIDTSSLFSPFDHSHIFRTPNNLCFVVWFNHSDLVHHPIDWCQLCGIRLQWKTSLSMVLWFNSNRSTWYFLGNGVDSVENIRSGERVRREISHFWDCLCVLLSLMRVKYICQIRSVNMIYNHGGLSMQSSWTKYRRINVMVSYGDLGWTTN